jgi:hypothetical protein
LFSGSFFFYIEGIASSQLICQWLELLSDGFPFIRVFINQLPDQFPVFAQ